MVSRHGRSLRARGHGLDDKRWLVTSKIEWFKSLAHFLWHLETYETRPEPIWQIERQSGGLRDVPWSALPCA